MRYGASVIFRLETAMLMAPARKPAPGVQTNKEPQGPVPDGAFLVKVNDAQIVYVLEANVRSSVLPPQTSTCRTPSRVSLTPRHAPGRATSRTHGGISKGMKRPPSSCSPTRKS